MRLYCAFVCHPTGDMNSYDARQDPPRLREDVQPAMEGIGTRSDAGSALEQIKDCELFVAKADLTSADLPKAKPAEAKLVKAELVGVDLTDANLADADLRHVPIELFPFSMLSPCRRFQTILIFGA